MNIEASTLMLASAAYVLALVVISFKPTVGLLLVISIGVVKTYLRTRMPALMESFTYDMAIVVLGVAAAVVHRLRSGSRVVSLPTGFIMCWIFLALLVWIRVPGSRAYDYGMKKALIFSIFNTLSCVVFALYVTSWRDMGRVIRTFTVLGVLAAMGMILFGEATARWKGARFTILGAGVLAAAAPIMPLLLIVIGAWLANQNWWRLLFVIVALPVTIYAIILSGTRAGLFLPPIAVLWMLWMYRRRLRMRVVVGVALGGAVVSALMMFYVDPDRMLRFRETEVSEGYNTRLTLAKSAWQGFTTSPIIGNGTGDWAYQWGGAGFEWYPHNHLLEVANELGIIGLIPYLLLMGYGLRACIRMAGSSWDGTEAKRYGVVVSACFIYYLLESLKSGTFTGSYITYVFLLLTVMVEVIWRRESAKLQVDEQYSRDAVALSTAQGPRFY